MSSTMVPERRISYIPTILSISAITEIKYIKTKLEILDEKKFDFSLIKNLTEANLIKKLGKSDFTKQEGKLKNFQYYFSKCFLDIYLIKKNNDYYVNFIQTRPTKLNGRI